MLNPNDYDWNIAITVGQCAPNPVVAGTYAMVTSVGSGVYNLYAGCSAGCADCTPFALTVDVCAEYSYYSYLLTTFNCNSGIDTSANTPGLAWSVVANTDECFVSTGSSYVINIQLGTCQYFYHFSAQLGYFKTVYSADSNYALHLGCNSDCSSCSLTYAPFPIGACGPYQGNAWHLRTVASLTSCAKSASIVEGVDTSNGTVIYAEPPPKKLGT